METTAEKATVELSMGRPRMKAKQTMAHTALMGVPVSGFTLDHSLCPGTPPSRENDHSILLNDMTAACSVRHLWLTELQPELACE